MAYQTGAQFVVLVRASFVFPFYVSGVSSVLFHRQYQCS